ncbi:hypothetical protein DY000_02047501 [Brassica cretica]|uniref:Uncharacterized protein n=1 Tax=Brassica cretica TaxID=69181 RepID=A0ABQ7EX74_BRACR|nr:hypothetical protein DY000_02047501 [Brassica cretica]
MNATLDSLQVMYGNSDDAFCLRKPWQATSTLKLTVLTREKMSFRHWWKECRLQPRPYTTIEEERVGVPVKRRLYEVPSFFAVLNHNTVGGLGEEALFHVYWNGDNWHVLRVQKLLPITWNFLIITRSGAEEGINPLGFFASHADLKVPGICEN